MLVATKYEILRNIKPSGLVSIPLENKPIRVATILNEDKMMAGGSKYNGAAMTHNVTVFFEDNVHDWFWQNGKFKYYTRITNEADVLIVYEMIDTKNMPLPEPGQS
jgi:hypothetical protein